MACLCFPGNLYKFGFMNLEETVLKCFIEEVDKPERKLQFLMIEVSIVSDVYTGCFRKSAAKL